MRKLLYVIIAALFLFTAVSCTALEKPAPLPQLNPSPKPPEPIQPVWLEATLSQGTISFPLNAVEQYWNTHFSLPTDDGIDVFTAYIHDGKIYIRPIVCPPCSARGFALNGDALVCDMCGDNFSAVTGEPLEDSCCNFPKAEVPYQVIGGMVVMALSLLLFM